MQINVFNQGGRTDKHNRRYMPRMAGESLLGPFTLTSGESWYMKSARVQIVLILAVGAIARIHRRVQSK